VCVDAELGTVDR